MKNIILSTAGHIDHGKTRLIEELTGKNTMHHKEEKLRNITIDLGYADITLKSEINVSIIDVPGHKDYLKNTICGILNSNMSILVISAIDGVCKQTIQHFNIINLTSINHLIIAVTKIDLASEAQIQDTLNQINELINSSNIQNISILTIDYKNKESIQNLSEKIYELAKDINQKNISKNIFKIDNSFTVKGYGTVISGNLISGSLTKNDEITIYPQNLKSKIKNMQSHSKTVETAYANTRLAINIQSIKREDVFRGNVLSISSNLQPSNIINVLIYTDNISKNIKNHEFVKLYTGTTSQTAKIVNLQDKLIYPNSKLLVQLRLKDNIMPFISDDIILLDTSSNEIISGGKIINVSNHKKNKIDFDISIFDIDELIFLFAIKEKKITDISTLKDIYNINCDKFLNCLKKLEKTNYIKLISFDNHTRHNLQYNKNSKYVADYNFYIKIYEKIKIIIKDFSQKFIYKKSINLNILHSKLNFVDKKYLFSMLIDMGYNIQSDCLILDNKNSNKVSEMKKLSDNLEILIESSEAPIKLKNITSDELSKEILHNNLKDKFVKISDDYICSKKMLNNYKNIIFNHFETNKTLDISEFKAYTNLSRKLSVTVLEYFDLQKITKMFENYRIKLYNGKL